MTETRDSASESKARREVGWWSVGAGWWSVGVEERGDEGRSAIEGHCHGHAQYEQKRGELQQ